MIVLAAIGRFFKKIWEWIKQTAWIQPLLIVGLIFGVIFSIPSIVKAVKSGKEAANKYDAYYHQFQLSLEKGKSETSRADELIYKLEDVMLGTDSANAVSEFKKAFPEAGDKFFLSFVGLSCEKCKDAKGGFEVLEENLNVKDTFPAYDERGFKMITVFSDEETTETDEKETAFVKFLSRHESFFEEVGSRAYQTDYYTKNHLNASDLEALETADPDDFLTPTILLVELDEVSLKRTGFDAGVTEVMFGVTGSDDFSKAKTLLDCWNHEGDFSVNEKID